MSQLNDKSNKFICPYCNQIKSTVELEYREEFAGAKAEFPWYRPNTIKIISYKGKYPICISCQKKIQFAEKESTKKALLLSLVFFAIGIGIWFISNKTVFLIITILFTTGLFFSEKELIKNRLLKKEGIVIKTKFCH